MVKSMMDDNLPDDAEIFRYSKGFRWMLLVLSIACAVFLFGGLVAFAFDKTSGSQLPKAVFVMAGYSLMFGSAMAYCFHAFLRSADFLAVNDLGIWFARSGKAPVFTAWGDIVAVKTHDQIQRLSLIDGFGRKINVEYQIGGFERLRGLIIRKALLKQWGEGSSRVFWRSTVIYATYFGSAIFFAVIALVAARDNADTAGWMLDAFALLSIVPLAFIPLKVVIGEDAFQIVYLFRRKSIPYWAISGVSLKNETNGQGYKMPWITVALKERKPVRLAGYRRGSIALFESIDSTWRRFSGQGRGEWATGGLAGTPESVGRKDSDGRPISLKRTALVTALSVLVPIAAFVGIRYGADYVYSRLRAGGLTPELPYAEEQVGRPVPVDVYLLPFEGFPDSVAGQIANVLAKELGLRIKTTPAVAIGPGRFDERRKQYVAELMGDPIARAVAQMDPPTRKRAYVGLLNADMYPQGANWNYTFAMHFEGRISVVAAGRLVPYGVLDRKEAARVYGVRLLKLVKRAIGQQYFDMPRSADKKCVMYSPLMSTRDLDVIGYEFEKQAGR